jgi:hypothetical protein
MKGKLLTILTIGAFFATGANAAWVYADSGKVLDSCCKKKRVVKKVKEPEVCLTCDYSKFPLAKLEPVGDEKLPPATLKNCGK